MRVLVVQLWGIGDAVMTLPSLKAIRTRNPSARVDCLVASQATATVIRLSGLADDVIIGSSPRRSTFYMTLLRLRRREYDAAIIATRQPARLASVVRSVSGIRHVIGDAPSRYQRGLHEADPEHRVISNLRLVERLLGSMDLTSPTLSPPVRPGGLPAMASLFRPGERLVGIHTGSEPAAPQKRYPTKQFIEVIQRLLISDPAIRILAFFGGQPSDDREAFAALDDRVHIIADQSLEAVVALIARCHLFISGDTGLGHIASALSVPTITIAGPTQIQSTRPFSAVNSIVCTAVALPCQPCYGGPLFGQCHHLSCLTTIAPSEIAERVIEVLNRDNSTIPRQN